jgi:fermentation-respiration switch protein FrsA (DUF1100 family)
VTPARHAPYAVGLRVVTFVDRSRHIRRPNGRVVPRTLVTYVRYPALGSASALDIRDAPAAVRRAPLVIFGHGYDITPAPYAPLLRAWARAGYVVAAPVFPLENSGAPGGPDESDLINQPTDMSFVISSLLTASGVPGGRFNDLIDAGQVAVSGQSDGGETALAVAYDRPYRDTRVRAALILSGAKIPRLAGFEYPPGSPPLLATQGTSDTINPPSFTADFFDVAMRPKYLLKLLGAPHLGPYTNEQPQLGIVERVTTAFLDRYLRRRPGALRAMQRAGNVAGVAKLDARP